MPPLLELADLLARPGQRTVDCYLERVQEVWWRVTGGHAVAREELRREAAGARHDGVLVAADGADRLTLAGLLGVPARTVPALSLPPFPTPPDPAPLLARLPDGAVVRWRWSWAAVLLPGAARVPTRPELLELSYPDGQRHLVVWPPPPGWQPPGPLPPADGALRGAPTPALLAPAVTATLLHELVGHPLEADLLAAGASPWCGRLGDRVFPIALDVTDDPSRLDLPGGFDCDDEGSAAAPRVLVREGRLAGVLGDRASAAMGAPPGNARRASAHDPPRPRGSNLLAAAPLDDLAALRRAARVEVLAVTGATLEPASWAVALAVRHAVVLRDGRPQRALRPMLLRAGLDAVCAGFLATAGPLEPATQPGWCGKGGEVVPVGAEAPWLLVTGLERR